MQISKRSFYVNILLFGFYVVLSVVTFWVTDEFLHMFLVWNLFLASIPFAIVYFIDRGKIKSKIAVGVALLFWLFFYPNSIYIVTDLIYIDVSQFIESGLGYGSIDYLQDLSSYLALFHIFLGSIIGIIYGFKSVSVLYILSVKTSFYKYRDFLTISVFFLAAVGIYIGRFFRYNSWEFFKVFQIAKDFFSTFSWFTIFFIFALTILQAIIFYAFKFNFTEKNNPKS